MLNKQTILGLAVIFLVAQGLTLYALPWLYPALIKEFGWSVAQVTAPVGYAYVVMALLAPVVGILLNRYSVRLMMALGAVLVVLALGWYASVGSLGDMKGAHVLLALGIAGISALPNLRLLERWLPAEEPFTFSRLLVAAAIGGALGMALLSWLTTDYGWSTALAALAVLAAVLLLAPLLLVVRDKPPAMELSEDGIPVEVLRDMPTLTSAPKLALRDKLRSSTWYLLVAIMALIGICTVTLFQHQALLITDLDATVSSQAVIGMLFVSQAVGIWFFNRLATRLDDPWLLRVALALAALGLGFLVLAFREPGLWLWWYALLFGIGGGGALLMIYRLLYDYLGRFHFGRLLALPLALSLLLGALGIFLLAQLRVADGHYLTGVWLLFALAGLAVVLGMVLPKTEA